MTRKILDTKVIDGRSLIFEYRVKEREYDIRGTKFRTSNYLNWLQWEGIEEAAVQFARTSLEKQMQRKVPSKKLCIRDNITLTLKLKECNTNYRAIMKIPPELLQVWRLEVHVEVIDQNFLKDLVFNENQCSINADINVTKKARDKSPPSHQKPSDLYLPTPSRQQSAPMTYTPKTLKKRLNAESSGEESYVPQSVGKKPFCVSTYTAAKVDDTVHKSSDPVTKRPRLCDEKVEIPSSEDNVADSEEQHDVSISELTEKYNNIKLPQEEKKQRKGVKKDTAKASSSSSTKRQTKLPTTQSGWINSKTSKEAAKKEKSEVDQKRILSLEKQERDLRKQNERDAETNRKLFALCASKAAPTPVTEKMLIIPNYTTEQLNEFYDTLFKEKAEKYFRSYSHSKRAPASEFALTYHDFTDPDTIIEMQEFFQNIFGTENDMGKHTDFFANTLVPEFSFELFKMCHNYNDEEATRQIKWQDHQRMLGVDERSISPILSD